jgi:hypothetical protein
MRSVNILILGILLATGAPCLVGQATPATTGAAKTTPPAAAKPAARSAKGAAKTKAKPAAKSAAPARAAAGGTGAGADMEPGGENKYARRDPFESLLARQQTGVAKNLPPGKAGLQVSTLRLDGIVKSSGGMIAVVSNPQARTYFLREGDQLYDGRVEKIAMDGVAFHEVGKDAFGKPVERQVNKRIYASAGEQQ